MDEGLSGHFRGREPDSVGVQQVLEFPWLVPWLVAPGGPRNSMGTKDVPYEGCVVLKRGEDVTVEVIRVGSDMEGGHPDAPTEAVRALGDHDPTRNMHDIEENSEFQLQPSNLQDESVETGLAGRPRAADVIGDLVVGKIEKSGARDRGSGTPSHVVQNLS